jgi:hypothetical protein
MCSAAPTFACVASDVGPALGIERPEAVYTRPSIASTRPVAQKTAATNQNSGSRRCTAPPRAFLFFRGGIQ